MKLGILVNTDDHLDDILGIVKAATKRGHEVSIFTMDRGTRLFGKEGYSNLCRTAGVKMSFCDFNAKMFDAQTSELPEEVVCGSQFDNAAMIHECEKVLVL